MGLCTANGVPVSRMRATMQIGGCWVLDLIASDVVAPGPVVVAVDGGLTFKGTAFRGGVWLDADYMRVLPGAGGMGKTARARSYRNVTAAVLVKDLLAAAGETLSPTSSAKVLATQFPFYSVNADAVGRCLSALLQDPRLAGATWRSLADGTVFVGTDSWPDSGLLAPGDYQDMAELPQEGSATLGFDSPVLVPGVLLEGRRVGAVEHNTDGEKCRTTVWFQDGTSLADRIKGAIYAIAKTAMPRLAYAAPRFARVVTSATSASGATTLDVVPEDATFSTLQGVPLFHGEPGEEMTLASGTRVLVEFSGADPAKPFVRSWAGGETVTKRTLSAGTLNLGGPSTEPAILGSTYRQAEDALFEAIDTFAGVLVSTCTGVGTLPQAAFAINSIGPAAASLVTALGVFKAQVLTYLARNARVQ